MSDFFLQDSLDHLDPDIKYIIDLENERQNRKLVMIPSESSAPAAIRESLGSIFQNIYAEGYPDENSRNLSEIEILDLDSQLTHYYRYSDPRYYKGVEYADVLESLARRRCAELFANEQVSSDQIFVNVQPLSGAPANNAVYQALIEPGDAILGMNLFHGGHLTHGSSVNRSGKLYTAHHYSVDPITERINYGLLAEIALNLKPKIIVAGYSSYSWCPDWKKFSEICKEIGAFLFADISHIAGLIAAKVIPSPVGFADVVTFTTHKTLCGPRGACILSFDEKLSRKIDKAVFPGEQGGPHVQVFAAMATTFKLAASAEFSKFQQQIVKNCIALSEQLSLRGLRIEYGGTDTHLINIDCKSVKSKDGTTLSGDMAARVLDLAGLVVNANTIPGDKSSAKASGIRLGTPWITQRGLVEKDMKVIADTIADLLFALQPYELKSGGKSTVRAKLDFLVLEKSKLTIKGLSEKALSTVNTKRSGLPSYHFIDDYNNLEDSKWVSFELTGNKIRQSLNFILPFDIETMKVGNNYQIKLLIQNEEHSGLITQLDSDKFIISIPSASAGLAASWLRDLSDGYIIFDEDLIKRIPGPFIVKESDIQLNHTKSINEIAFKKPYFIGINHSNQPDNELPLPNYIWEEKEPQKLKRTILFDWHSKSGAKIIPFAGWEMPVWYSSVLEEHHATRHHAGLFDVSHMGVYEAEGVDAVAFLDSVCANDISALEIGQSCYTHFLLPNADVIDDLLVYYHDQNKYLLVVNAANDDKDWKWLNEVKDRKVKVDELRPWSHSFGTQVILRNLKDPAEGKRMRVDIALQGPASLQIMNNLELGVEDRKNINKLKRTELCHVLWNDLDLIVSRTGYTGEKMSFEIFIHPNGALRLWEQLIDVGSTIGLKPCGLGARDSLRTEAGLPLYGHEMASERNLGVGEAGFSSYVKTYKPWFIGRDAFMKKEATRKSEVIRFKFDQQRVRLAHYGDPVLDEKGKIIGFVTSCAVDTAGYINGQAFIEKEYGYEGTNIYIYQNVGTIKSIDLQELNIGKRIILPNKATVISRFARL